jgi:hypothetical protein
MHLLERGVYFVPCLDEGGFYFLAVVDSRHRVIHRQRLFSLNEKRDQARACWRLLNCEDPLPHSQDRADIQPFPLP